MFMHTEEALAIANRTPVFDSEDFWIVNLVMDNGDVYQAMSLFYTFDEVIQYIHSAMLDNEEGGYPGLREIVIV
jgi:hypothetical protein